MSVKIITDSTSDITQEIAKEWGVEIVPLTVNIDEVEYVDGITLTADAFYDKLAASENLPTTSQVTVDTFLNAFEKATADGSEIVCITLSSELSGTFQSASIAKSTLESDRIHLIDSRTVTLGLALLVNRAVALRDEGKTAAEITEEITQLIGKLKLYAMIDTLKYLQKGGRLSAASAVVGTMLGIKPIIAVQDGKVEVIHKARGVKTALEWVATTAKKANPNLELGCSMGHSNSATQLETFVGVLPEFEQHSKITCCIGAVVGTHAGPGCVGVAFFEK